MRVVDDNSFVTDTPEKLKNAIDSVLPIVAMIITGLSAIWQNADGKCSRRWSGLAWDSLHVIKLNWKQKEFSFFFLQISYWLTGIKRTQRVINPKIPSQPINCKGGISYRPIKLSW